MNRLSNKLFIILFRYWNLFDLQNMAILFAILSLLFTTAKTQANEPSNQPQWRKTYEAEDIVVYKKPISNNSINAFLSRAEINAPVSAILAVMSDPSVCSQWIHNCSHAEILDSDSFLHRNTYQVNDMPWPAQDRDIVLEIEVVEDKISNRITMYMHNRPQYVAESHLVRIEKSEGKYVFYPRGNKTLVEWTQHTDPGGKLPGWLVNTLLIDVPVNTMRNLNRLVQKEPYQSARFKRNEEGIIVGWVSHVTLIQ